MDIPLHAFVNEVVPVLKRRIAQHLSAGDLSQRKIAEHLGVTQAMVSKYVAARMRSEIGANGLAVEAAAMELAAMISDGLPHEVQNRRVARLARDLYPEEAQLLVQDSVGPVGKMEVLEDLNRALVLLSAVEFEILEPEVRTNICRALPTPKTVQEIAAVPGRLTCVDGHLHSLSQAAFGASNHLAGILLEVSPRQQNCSAVINLRWNDAIEEAIGDCGWIPALLDHEQPDPLRQVKLSSPALVDRGDFGIEPCLYLFASTAVELVALVVRLRQSLSTSSSPQL